MTLPQFSPARLEFTREVRQVDAEICLERAAFWIAAEVDPSLDFEMYLQRLDTLTAAVEPLLPAERYPLRVVKAINTVLFEQEGFRGNRDRYYDPLNSFVPIVLQRRTGIPITLSLIYCAIAQRLDFPMVGIGMPGHFLIRPDFEDANIFIDAFHGGEILFPEDCEARLAQVYGRSVPLQPEFLQPVTKRQWLVRMLTNLKAVYLSQNDFVQTLAAVERILIVNPASVSDLRDRGLLHYQLQNWSAARQDLQAYLDQAPTAGDRLPIADLLEHLETRDD